MYIYVSTSVLLFHGPFPTLTHYVIEIFTTSMHGYLLRPMSMYTLSQAEIDQYAPKLVIAPITAADRMHAQANYSNIHNSSITVSTYTQPMFTANVMLIRNPTRLTVAVTKFNGSVGQTVSELVAQAHGVAGVNGGAFKDNAQTWQGTGGIPLGITITNGQVVNGSNLGSSYPTIGLTQNGALIVGPYNLEQLQSLHVDQALSFGPVLVEGGNDMIQGDGGWGYAPRTAIGQRSDGTIILAVTDGRYIHGPNNMGASLQDMAQLMLHYGAVVAANLDGGSSTTMVNNGQLVNQPSDPLGEREVATALVVQPEK
ncbi:phosphodiester glycosidase family protein [Alicyclobacillaceae bacterium I2511]|nr:phosphodiester glycosidase family protein [Alicyclobacillaceae bacterium I2511]